MLSLIGKTILYIKSDKPEGIKISKKDRIYLNPYYILFDDKETYIELREQDYYSYHDCSSSARHVDINHNKEVWKILSQNLDANQNEV